MVRRYSCAAALGAAIVASLTTTATAQVDDDRELKGGIPFHGGCVVRDVVWQGDKIIAVGLVGPDEDHCKLVIARFNADGSLDTGPAGFGDTDEAGGKRGFIIDSLAGYELVRGHALEIDTLNRVVVTGVAKAASGPHVGFIARYSVDGQPDDEFDWDADLHWVTVTVTDSQHVFLRDIACIEEKYIATGYCGSHGAYDMLCVHCTANGQVSPFPSPTPERNRGAKALAIREKSPGEAWAAYAVGWDAPNNGEEKATPFDTAIRIFDNKGGFGPFFPKQPAGNNDWVFGAAYHQGIARLATGGFVDSSMVVYLFEKQLKLLDTLRPPSAFLQGDIRSFCRDVVFTTDGTRLAAVGNCLSFGDNGDGNDFMFVLFEQDGSHVAGVDHKIDIGSLEDRAIAVDYNDQSGLFVAAGRVAREKPDAPEAKEHVMGFALYDKQGKHTASWTQSIEERQ